MSSPQPGDLLVFTKLSLAQGLRQGWRGVGGYLSNGLISFWQWENQGNKDGAATAVHAAFIGRISSTGEPLVAEFTAGQKGPGLRGLTERIANYPGGVWLLPLGERARAKFNEVALDQWLSDHRDTLYNYAGLPFACNRWLKGVHFDGRLFCSEAVCSMLIETGVLSEQYPAFNGRRYVPVLNQPHWLGPIDICRLPCIDRSGIRLLNP